MAAGESSALRQVSYRSLGPSYALPLSVDPRNVFTGVKKLHSRGFECILGIVSIYAVWTQHEAPERSGTHLATIDGEKIQDMDIV